MARQKDCLFCKIIEKEIASDIIFEDETIFGFLDAHPISPGHTLVIPKNHYDNFSQITPEDAASLFTVAQKIANAIKAVYQCPGFTIGINDGKVAGQAIGHLHMHIIPRFEGDNGRSIHSVVDNPPQPQEVAAKKDAIASHIKK